jgi:hypothetical protein
VTRFLLARVALLVPTLLGVLAVTFLLLYVAPGDPVQAMVGERADSATIAGFRWRTIGPANFEGRVAELSRTFVDRMAALGGPKAPAFFVFKSGELIYDRNDTRSTAAILTEDPGMIFAGVSWVVIALLMLYVVD